LRRARLRPQAEQDLLEAARYFAREGGTASDARMFDAAPAALKPTQRMTGMGSLRFAERGGIPGVRSWRVGDFPMRGFYFGHDGHLDVVRLLGERPDIEAILAKDE
jgi:toxin ParE1/3/4